MKVIVFLAVLLFAPPAFAAAAIGQPAPDFSVSDTDGNPQNLKAYQGRVVVLEWTNPQCPYVHKHYDSGSMQRTQTKALNQGVVWLSIVSSARGREGYMTATEANTYRHEVGTHVPRILDVDGALGRLYGATATPDMYVINKEGTLVYEGAIDNMPTPRPDTLDGADNYVLDALADLAAGRPVARSVTQPYGCAVKYAE